jgi:ABC-2 type transport system permease protein
LWKGKKPLLAKQVAFLKRDAGIAATYRFRFAQSFALVAFGLVSMYFLARLVEGGAPTGLAPYGNDYFGFALVGTGMMLFAQAIAGQFPAAVRNAQVTGTLEVITASRTSLPSFLGCSALFGSAEALVRLLVALVIGAVVLGAELRADEALLALLVLVLTAATFAGIGVLAAAFTARFNQTEPFTGAFMTASMLLSGALYPTSVLPGWLESLAPLLPLTHAIEGLRSVILESAPPLSLAGDLLVLAGFALLLPLGLIVFGLAVKQARAEGTLGHY